MPQDAASASATAARLAKIRYQGGMVDFLVGAGCGADAAPGRGRARPDRTEAATSLIAVYKALGGGWETAPLPRYTDASVSR